MDSLSHHAPEKQCTGPCKRWLPATTEFFYADGKWLMNKCKECKSAATKSRKLIPEVHQRELERARAYKKRPDVQERRREVARAYMERPEVRERYREYHRVYNPAYANRPGVRERYRVHWNNRSARKRSNDGTHTIQQIQEQLARQKYKCYYCSAKLTEYHIEHIVPLSRGGSNSIDNIVLACPTCNISKNDRMPHEWHKGGRLL